MAHYLFTVWSFSGHINPSLATASALRARGHEVAFYTGARAAATLRELGMTHFPMRCVDEERLYRRLFPSDDGGGRTALSALPRLRATLLAWLLDTVPAQLADLEPIIDHWQPDAIVCDPTMNAPLLVTHESRSIPVAILSYTMGCMLSGSNTPPWGRGIGPGTSPTGRLRVAVERFLARRAGGVFQDQATALRARHGLTPLSSTVTDFAGTMPLYLVTSIPELDYNRRDLPSTVHYVGRCAWDRPSHQPPPAWIESLPTDRPIVYVTEGTVQSGQPKLLQAAARGLAGLPVQVVLTLNADRDPAAAGLASLAPNVRLETYTPGRGWQNDILARASLVVTNGGAGSVMAALSYGVPLIVVPTAWDKPENAQRVVAAGVGVQLSPNRCTPERLRAAVPHVLNQPAFRTNARRVADRLGRFDGATRAAELLEDLCAAQHPFTIRASREVAMARTAEP